MNGLMMNYPLTVTHLLERSVQLYGTQEVASRFQDGMHRLSYLQFYERTHRLAHVLAKLGVAHGSRVGTLCWNSHRHLELYFAVPAYGAVLHTLNLRLSDDQLAYIINHASDEVIFCDASLLPILQRVRDQIPCVRAVVVLPDEPAHHGEALDYEVMLHEAPGDPFPWPDLDEREACATCYTSGTTGNPKGVLYDHRSIFLHSMSLSMTGVFGFCEKDVLLQLVPMFHANGWGMPYAAVMNGMKIVLSGRQLQPADIAAMIQDERVTFSAGVPTIWMGLYGYLEANPGIDVSSLRTVVAAGSAMPRQFIEWYGRRYGVEFRLAWGMTETTPIATVTVAKPGHASLAEDQKYDLLARHGRVSAGLELRIVDENRNPVEADGKTMGELQIRGAWITDGYFEDPRTPQEAATSFDVDARGHRWFRTGDVATIDADGYIQIMDRTKDLVKSGGEWISSVDLENMIMAHPGVAEAAVIAIPHPKWEERPLACVVKREESLTKEDVIEFLRPRVAKWWLPDDVVFIEAVPKTSVGKFNKRALRAQFEGFGNP
jgi:fatty-acyl-CoA synthase